MHDERSTMRTFVAVDVSNLEIAKLQNEILSTARWNLRDVKPVECGNIHFTLIFLGEVGDHDLEKIKEKLAQLQFESFRLNYEGIGAFPNPAVARVVWIGVDPHGGQKLIALAQNVIVKMSELGFKADKPFSPHMTLFRAKGRPLRLSDISAQYKGRTLGSDMVDRVQLKKSELTPSGPIYSNIYTIQANK
jgi:RNA 2',3'-cyclic 3'-phosphodiesterase